MFFYDFYCWISILFYYEIKVYGKVENKFLGYWFSLFRRFCVEMKFLLSDRRVVVLLNYILRLFYLVF